MAAIKREDLDAGRVDLSNVVKPTAAPLPPVNPGQVLRAEFLEPLELSVGAVARAIRVPRNRLSAILNGSLAITADTALRLGIYFGISPEFWLSLQPSYDDRSAPS
jgi:addiction module HigA family antidote